MTERENRIRAWRFEHPRWIPFASGLPWLDWAAYGYDTRELEQVCLDHPRICPGFAPGDLTRNHARVGQIRPDLVAGSPYRDGWGCQWQTLTTGMVGSVVRHPLADWADFSALSAPDPDQHDGMLPLDWPHLRVARQQARDADGFFGLGLPHGHTFLRLQDLRGYENLIMDMADGDPRLDQLIERVTGFNEKLVHRMIALQPDVLCIPEDLGMQNSPMLSPEQFRRYIAPAYRRLSAPARAAGVLVHQHSDGFILPLVDDLIDSGADVLNLQDLVNGIDAIAQHVKGRVAIDLDLDRQRITVKATPADIDAHVRECVAKLNTPAGGLSLCYQPWPPTPVRNIRAVFEAMEKYSVLDRSINRSACEF